MLGPPTKGSEGVLQTVSRGEAVWFIFWKSDPGRKHQGEEGRGKQRREKKGGEGRTEQDRGKNGGSLNAGQ